MTRLARRESVGYLVNHLARLMARALHAEISAHRVVPGQFPVLLALWEEDGLTQAELHRRTEVEQATMANTLQRMERDSLIVRKADSADARRARVHLTARARSLEPLLVRAAGRVNDRTTAGLPVEERERFVRLLRSAIEALGSSVRQPRGRRTNRARRAIDG